MNYEAILWMQSHKHLYDDAMDLAIDCTSILNLWHQDKYGYHNQLSSEIIKEAKVIFDKYQDMVQYNNKVQDD